MSGRTLRTLASLDGFNAVYREAFSEPFPVRTTVQVGLPAGLLVELDAVARVPS